jgi:cytochrome c5
LLAWDAVSKDQTVKSGTATTSFVFQVTNVSKEPIVFTSIRTSCACTVAKLPRTPWTLEPGEKGNIDATMNLAGKRGVVAKRVLVISDHGFETLNVRTTIQEAPAGAIGEGERMRNLQIATANRQAVLKGECASCHSTPAIGKTGAELYQAACTICHEGEHRASIVPDLKHLQKATNAEYWRTWITSSAEGKLMPAFGIDHGGILTAAQIDSLVKYLVETIPSTPPAEPSAGSKPGNGR